MGEINWASLKQQADDATKPLEDGDYEVQVTKSELKTSQTGSQMVVVVMTVTKGPRAGRNLFNNFVFAPDKPFALKMWFDNLAAFGLNDAFFAQGPSLEQVAAALLQRYAIVTTGQREYPAGSGTIRNECTGFKKVTGGMASDPAGLPATVAGAPPVPTTASVAPTPTLPPVPASAAGTSTPPTPNF